MRAPPHQSVNARQGGLIPGNGCRDLTYYRKDGIGQSPEMNYIDEHAKSKVTGESWTENANEIESLRKLNSELVAALQLLYDADMDYIRINKLSGAENNQALCSARAVLARAAESKLFDAMRIIAGTINSEHALDYVRGIARASVASYRRGTT